MYAQIHRFKVVDGLTEENKVLGFNPADFKRLNARLFQVVYISRDGALRLIVAVGKASTVVKKGEVTMPDFLRDLLQVNRQNEVEIGRYVSEAKLESCYVMAEINKMEKLVNGNWQQQSDESWFLSTDLQHLASNFVKQNNKKILYFGDTQTMGVIIHGAFGEEAHFYRNY
uniref:Uncharacterized protein n=1 Tax=Acrobeloides nanus TaxID=290746 RepID=A0A914D0P8_9BILA